MVNIGLWRACHQNKGMYHEAKYFGFLIDVLTFLVFFAMFRLGLLIHYVLPPGGGRGHALTLWGMDRHDYGNVHFYLALAMVALIIVRQFDLLAIPTFKSMQFFTSNDKTIH